MCRVIERGVSVGWCACVGGRWPGRHFRRVRLVPLGERTWRSVTWSDRTSRSVRRRRAGLGGGGRGCERTDRDGCETGSGYESRRLFLLTPGRAGVTLVLTKAPRSDRGRRLLDRDTPCSKATPVLGSGATFDAPVAPCAHLGYLWTLRWLPPVHLSIAVSAKCYFEEIAVGIRSGCDQRIRPTLKQADTAAVALHERPA